MIHKHYTITNLMVELIQRNQMILIKTQRHTDLAWITFITHTSDVCLEVLFLSILPMLLE